MKLRQRIIDFMPEILEEIANEKRGVGMGGDGDFRPAIVRSIQRIAELNSPPPHEERTKLDKAARHLRRAKQLIEEAQRFSVLRDLDAVLDKVKEMRKSKPWGTGRPASSRKRLAAAEACDLLLDFGGARVSLTPDGAYVTLANLLYNTAMAGETDLYRVCKEHFQALKTNDELDLYARKGKRPRPPLALKRLADAQIKACRARRIEAAKKWRPVQQIVDEVLMRSNSLRF